MLPAVCWTSIALMSMDSQFAIPFCTLCADVCDACDKECERHGLDHSKQCAQAYSIGGEECRGIEKITTSSATTVEPDL